MRVAAASELIPFNLKSMAFTGEEIFNLAKIDRGFRVQILFRQPHSQSCNGMTVNFEKEPAGAENQSDLNFRPRGITFSLQSYTSLISIA